MNDFKNLIEMVINANGNKEKIESLLKPIHDDSRRIQHLEDFKNDIFPWDDPEAPCPMVNAEWLLRTPDGYKDGADVRTFIDDDMKYWTNEGY